MMAQSHARHHALNAPAKLHAMRAFHHLNRPRRRPTRSSALLLLSAFKRISSPQALQFTTKAQPCRSPTPPFDPILNNRSEAGDRSAAPVRLACWLGPQPGVADIGVSGGVASESPRPRRHHGTEILAKRPQQASQQPGTQRASGSSISSNTPRSNAMPWGGRRRGRRRRLVPLLVVASSLGAWVECSW